MSKPLRRFYMSGQAKETKKNGATKKAPGEGGFDKMAEDEVVKQLDKIDNKLNALLTLKMLTIDFGNISTGYCRDKSIDILNEYVDSEEAELLRNKY